MAGGEMLNRYSKIHGMKSTDERDKEMRRAERLMKGQG